MTRTTLFAGILLIVLTSGCARFFPDQDLPDPLADAQRLQDEGKYAQSLEAYRTFLREHPSSEWAATAKYSIALIHVAPGNPKRNYATALGEFEDFAKQYPQHARAEEARSWQLALRSFLDSRKENERLNQNIERLKQLDVKQEEKRRGR